MAYRPRAAWLGIFVTYVYFSVINCGVASQVLFAPLPALPTLDECQSVNNNDIQTITAWHNSEQARIEAEGNAICQGNFSVTGCDRVNHDFNILSNQFSDLQQQVNQRYSQCIAEANAAQSSGQQPVSQRLLSSTGTAWMSGVGSIPAGAWNGLKNGQNGLLSFTAVASQTIARAQQAASTLLRVRFAQDVIGLAMNPSPSRADRYGSFWQTEDYANDVLGANLPPWSSLFTTFAVNAIRAINSDATRQLDTEIARFDASAVPGVIAQQATELIRIRTLPQSTYSPDSAVTDALSQLDAVVQEMAELSQQVAAQLADDQRADAARRAAIEAKRAEAARQAAVTRPQAPYQMRPVPPPVQTPQPTWVPGDSNPVCGTNPYTGQRSCQ